MNVKQYWYKTTILYCPVCGREKRYRERQYGQKPKDYKIEIKEVYDYCEEYVMNNEHLNINY